MQDQLTIGLLLPASSILPLGKDFESGLTEGLNDVQGMVKVEREFVGNGDYRKMEEACDKFINYDHAQLVTGIVNNRAAHNLAPKFSSKDSTFFVNNVGETWPDAMSLGSSVLLNSTHAWKQVYALGKWAVENIGNKGIFVSGFYDSGYSFMSAMDEGMKSSSIENSWGFAVAPAPNARDGQLAEVEKVIPVILEQKPDFVFASFCGEEASLFLKMYVEAGLAETPLIGLPSFVEPFENAKNEVLTIYSSRSSFDSEESVETSPSDWKGDYFQLGLETGKAITKAVQAEGDFHGALRDSKTDDSGTSIFDPSHSGVGYKSTLYKLETTTGRDLKAVEVARFDTPTMADETLKKVAQKQSSGWFNPYLCV